MKTTSILRKYDSHYLNNTKVSRTLFLTTLKKALKSTGSEVTPKDIISSLHNGKIKAFTIDNQKFQITPQTKIIITIDHILQQMDYYGELNRDTVLFDIPRKYLYKRK